MPQWYWGLFRGFRPRSTFRLRVCLDLLVDCFGSGLEALALIPALFVRKKEEKPKKRRVISRGGFAATQLRRP